MKRKVEKYMRDNDADAAIFVLSIGKAKLYNSKHEAADGIEPWQKVIKVTVEVV